ncbi:MAG: hypothetical protein HT580_01025 [Dechloromonas sp.]|nr:MAG: hypothetical protein HT580_01025 [Dechloromonas sp.]
MGGKLASLPVFQSVSSAARQPRIVWGIVARGLGCPLRLTYSLDFLLAVVIYLFAVGSGLLASILWQKRFNMQLSLQVLTDVTALGSLMFTGGGIGSGVGTLMLVSLATASLVGRGRLVLFYAAMATLVTLGGQVVGVVLGDFEPATIVQAGFLSVGFLRQPYLPDCSGSD